MLPHINIDRMNAERRMQGGLAPVETRGGHPLVSVIMPAYNQGKYIGEALDSLLRQTYENWEVLIVDDGSPDNVAETVKPYLESDPRIRFFHTENRGVSAARNYAVGMSGGVFILPLDADDTIEPDYIRKCVDVFESAPSTDVVYCQWRYFGADDRTPDISYPGYRSLLLCNRIFVTAMMRRDKFLSAGGFDEAMRKGLEDWEFWIRFLDEESIVVQISQKLFNYRIKESSRNVEAHKGTGLFDIELYILAKHKETYNRYFGSPIIGLGGFARDARKYRQKYDRVFYRRLWHWMNGLFRK